MHSNDERSKKDENAEEQMLFYVVEEKPDYKSKNQFNKKVCTNSKKEGLTKAKCWFLHDVINYQTKQRKNNTSK